MAPRALGCPSRVIFDGFSRLCPPRAWPLRPESGPEAGRDRCREEIYPAPDKSPAHGLSSSFRLLLEGALIVRLGSEVIHPGVFRNLPARITGQAQSGVAARPENCRTSTVRAREVVCRRTYWVGRSGSVAEISDNYPSEIETTNFGRIVIYRTAIIIGSTANDSISAPAPVLKQGRNSLVICCCRIASLSLPPAIVQRDDA